MQTTNNGLTKILTPPARSIWSRSPAVQVLIVIVGSIALTLSAKFSVPFYPVPMTLQTLVVLMLGAFVGPRPAAATVLCYLAQGAVGLPVFAGSPERGIGLAYMAGPTGGFLIGFICAAIITGVLAQRGWNRSFFPAMAAMVIGTVAIYIPGLLWLGAVIGWDKPVLTLGMLPFLLGDVVKILLASTLMPLARRIVSEMP